MTRSAPAWAFALVIAGCGASDAKPVVPAPASPTIVLHHATVVQKGGARASAVVLRGDKIAAVGGEELVASAGPGAQVVDLGGATVLPGLRDSHIHLGGLGRKLAGRDLDLSSARSVAEIEERIIAWRRERQVPPGAWISGSGWSDIGIGAALPQTTAPLDRAAPDNPVILVRKDGHTSWANRRALALAGIGRDTPSPPGGAIVHDASGELTGVLVDAGERLVLRLVPPETRAEVEEDLVAAMNACARAGLVEVHEAGVGIEEEKALRHLAETGRMPIRVYAMLGGRRPDLDARLREAPIVEPIGGRLTIRAVKMFADGALGSHGALMLAPYNDQATNGLRTTPPAELERVARLARTRGYQLAVHAIGDAANREVLDVFQRVLGGPNELRFRIEHASFVESSDVDRFTNLSIIASMQPAPRIGPMIAERVGAARVDELNRFRTFLGRHIHVAFGSDAPAILDEHPFHGLTTAIMQYGLSFEEALRAYTVEPAYASFAEARRGEIAVGADADLTVVRDDVLALATQRPRALADVEVLGTWVGGVSQPALPRTIWK